MARDHMEHDDFAHSTPFTGLGQRGLVAADVQEMLPAGATRADCLRWVLRIYRRPMEALELGRISGMANGSLVASLLKHDLASGVVTYIEGKYEFDEITAAAVLLRRRGFTVREPA